MTRHSMFKFAEFKFLEFTKQQNICVCRINCEFTFLTRLFAFLRNFKISKTISFGLLTNEMHLFLQKKFV